MYRFLRLSAVALCAGAVLMAAGPAYAAPGGLDLSFGSGGFATAPANSTYPSTGANEIALTPTGQILAAGLLYDGSIYRFSVQRFNSNGSIDTSFGDGGLATAALPAGTAINAVTGVGAQPDGSVVVGARVYPTPAATPGKFAVVRFTPTGELDTGFDGDSAGNGILQLEIGPILPPAPSETARKLIVEPSGKIVMSGGSYYSSTASLAIGRLNADGTWDSSFSGDGKLSVPFNTTAVDFKALADVPGDAGYVIGGFALPGGGPTITQPTLVRITEGGALDSSFAGGPGNKSATPGIVTYYWSADNTQLGEVVAVAPAPGGGFVAGGYQNTPASGTFLGMARYSASGALDPSFGTSGVRLSQIGGGNSGVNDLAVQPDGKILGGLSGVDFNTGFVGRFHTDGSPDTTFGSGGLVDPTSAGISRVALQPDGKLVTTVARLGQTNTTLMRLLADDPVVPEIVPELKITSPSKRKLKRSKLRTLAGTAGPAGLVKKVEIALRRKDSKLLKKKKRCAWLSSTKVKFKHTKASKGKCSKPYFRKASGTTKWKYRVTKSLPVGSYALTARVTLIDGRSASKTFSFKLKRK